MKPMEDCPLWLGITRAPLVFTVDETVIIEPPRLVADEPTLLRDLACTTPPTLAIRIDDLRGRPAPLRLDELRGDDPSQAAAA